MPCDYIDKQICYVNLDRALIDEFVYVEYLFDVENESFVF